MTMFDFWNVQLNLLAISSQVINIFHLLFLSARNKEACPCVFREKSPLKFLYGTLVQVDEIISFCAFLCFWF